MAVIIDINYKQATESEHNQGVASVNQTQTSSSFSTGSNNQGVQNVRSTVGVAVATMVAQRTLQYATSNIGKWTGNSNNQKIVNNINQIIGIGVMAMANPYIAAANVAMSLVTNAIDNAYENKWQTASSNKRLSKAGYNSVGEVVGRRR